MTDNVHLRRLRHLSAVLLAVAGPLAVAACGGATFEDEAATTTAPAEESPAEDGDGFSPEEVRLGEEVLAQLDLQSGEVDEVESGCLGFTLIDALGDADAQDVLTTETPTPAQLAALEAGFDACISGTTLAPEITALFFDELPGAPVPDQSVVSCVAGEIDGATGQLIVGLFDASETGGLPTQFLDTLDVCVPDDVVADLFVEELSSDGTFDQAQATCIAERVAPQLSISTLAAAGQADGLPADVEALIEEATLACLAGG
jgi:hypothetical protein